MQKILLCVEDKVLKENCKQLFQRDKPSGRELLLLQMILINRYKKNCFNKKNYQICLILIIKKSEMKAVQVFLILASVATFVSGKKRM